MKIVCDNAIPFLQGVFEPYADVVYEDGPAISRDTLFGADALLVRTRTRCGASLLDGTSVRAVATATIGTDHIEVPWCLSHGITVDSAPGCNAMGVMNYVMTAVYAVAARKGLDVSGMTLGIIGSGHVGSLVAEAGRKLGLRVLECDPPRAKREGPDGFVPLELILAESDIVSLHIPHDDSTRDLAGEDFFRRMKPGAMFINTSRGEVVCEDALIEAVPKLGAVIVDTWRSEPKISSALVDAADIATPHIAGYTLQGKAEGTRMAVRALAGRLGIGPLKDFNPAGAAPERPVLSLSGESQERINEVLQYNYPIFTDDSALRSDISSFERLRTGYSYRSEFLID